MVRTVVGTVVGTVVSRVRDAVARAVVAAADYNDRWVLELHEPWQDGARVVCGGPHRGRLPDWPCRAWSAADARRAARRRRGAAR
jgi:hypothetical protein